MATNQNDPRFQRFLRTDEEAADPRFSRFGGSPETAAGAPTTPEGEDVSLPAVRAAPPSTEAPPSTDPAPGVAPASVSRADAARGAFTDHVRDEVQPDGSIIRSQLAGSIPDIRSALVRAGETGTHRVMSDVEITIVDEPDVEVPAMSPLGIPLGRGRGGEPVDEAIDERRRLRQEADEQRERGRGLDPRVRDRFLHAANRASQGAAGSYAGTGEFIAFAAKQLDEVLPEMVQSYDDMDIQDLATWQWAQRLRAGAAGLFPDDDRLQEDFWWDLVPSAIGSFGGFITGGIAGGIARRLGVQAGARSAGQNLAPEILAQAQKQGALRASAVLAGSSGISHAYQEAVHAGIPEGDARVAGRWGVLGGLVQIFPAVRAIDRLMGRVPAPTRSRILNAVKEGSKGAVEEGFAEMLGQMTFNAIAREFHDEDREIIEGLWRAGGPAAVAGFMVSAIGGAQVTSRQLHDTYHQGEEFAPFEITRQEQLEAVEGTPEDAPGPERLPEMETPALPEIESVAPQEAPPADPAPTEPTPARPPQEPGDLPSPASAAAAPAGPVATQAIPMGEPVTMTPGREVEVRVPDGRTVRGHYAVVDSREAPTSHDPLTLQPDPRFPEGIQERRYHADASAREQLAEATAAFAPGEILDPTAMSTSGPPIMRADGVRLSGNFRGMLLNRTRESNPEGFQGYLDSLVDQSEAFGFTPDQTRERIQEILEAGGTPELVRVLDDPAVDLVGQESLAEWMSAFNDVPTRARDPLGEAATRARRMRDATGALDHFTETIQPDETVRSYLGTAAGRRFLSNLVEEGVIPREESSRFFDRRTGAATNDGRSAIERLLLVAAVQDADVVDQAPAGVLRKVEKAVPALIQSQNLPGWDLTGVLQEALQISTQARASGLSVIENVQQIDITRPPWGMEAERLALYIDEHGPNQVAAAIRGYTQEALAANDQLQSEDLFGFEPRSPQDAFLAHFSPETELGQGDAGTTVRERIARYQRWRRWIAGIISPELRTEAEKDFLTGLSNVRMDQRTIEDALERRGDAPETQLVRMRVDIDNFKRVNDDLGHQAGDEALRIVGRVLGAGIRDGDVVSPGRVGGDEFALTVTIPRGVNPDVVRTRLEGEIQDALRVAGLSEAEGFPVGASIGWAIHQDGESFLELDARADLAAIERKAELGRSVPRDESARIQDATDRLNNDVREVTPTDHTRSAAIIHGSELDATRTAQRIIQRSPNVATVSRVPVDLSLEARMGRIAEAGSRAWVTPVGKEVTGPESIHEIMSPFVRSPSNETLAVVLTDQNGRILYTEGYSSGAIDHVHLGSEFGPYVRQLAERHQAAGVWVTHNHPSGDPMPSPEDIALTRNVRDALDGNSAGAVLEGHYIINHRTGYLVQSRKNADGTIDSGIRKQVQLPPSSRRDWTDERGPRVHPEMSPESLTGLVDVFDPEVAYVVWTDATLRVVAVTPHRPEALETLPEWFDPLREQVGAITAGIVVPSGELAGPAGADGETALRRAQEQVSRAGLDHPRGVFDLWAIADDGTMSAQLRTDYTLQEAAEGDRVLADRIFSFAPQSEASLSERDQGIGEMKPDQAWASHDTGHQLEPLEPAPLTPTRPYQVERSEYMERDFGRDGLPFPPGEPGRLARDREWRLDTLAAVSEGLLSPEEATEAGLPAEAVEGMVPLPRELYHVTPAIEAVLQVGLRTGFQAGASTGETLSLVTDRDAAEGLRAEIAETLEPGRRASDVAVITVRPVEGARGARVGDGWRIHSGRAVEVIQVDGRPPEMVKEDVHPYDSTDYSARIIAPVVYRAVSQGDVAGIQHNHIHNHLRVIQQGQVREVNEKGELVPIQEVPRRSDIVRDIERTIGRPFQIGKVRKLARAFGLYHITPETFAIRVANDVEVIAHELGHHVHKLLWDIRGVRTSKFPGGAAKVTQLEGLEEAPLQQWKSELMPLATTSDKSISEGFAEFWRVWLTNKEQAEQLAPQLTEYLQDRLALEHPELWAGMQRWQQAYEAYASGSPWARILAQLAHDPPKRSVGARRKFHRRYKEIVNDLVFLDRFEEEMTGTNIPSPEFIESMPGHMADLARGAAGEADHILRRAPINTKGEALTEVEILDRDAMRPLIDRIRSLQRSAKKTSGALSRDLEAQAERLMRDAEITTTTREAKSLEAILDQIADQEIMDFEVYAVARRAKELHERSIESGISLEDAEATIAQYDEARPNYREAFEDLQAYNTALLQLLRDGGVITESSYRAIILNNIDYVPFFRRMEDRDGRTGGPSGTRGIHGHIFSPIRKIKGSGRDILSPLDSVIKNTFLYTRLVANQQVSNAIQDLAGLEGSGAWLQEVDPPQKVTQVHRDEILQWLFQQEGMKGFEDLSSEMSDLEASELNQLFEETMMIYRPGDFFQEPNTISVLQDDGTRRWFKVDPDLYDSLMALTPERANALTQIMSYPAQWLRAGATSLSPEFILRNPLRDQFIGFMQSEYGYLPGIDLARGLFHLLGKTDAYWSWKRSRGEFASFIDMDRNSLKEKQAQLTAMGRIPHVVKNPLMMMQIASAWMESATRLGEYTNAIRAGGQRMGKIERLVKEMSPSWRAAARQRIEGQGVDRGLQLLAGHASREIGTNYSTHGSAKLVEFARLTAPFWNARIQGHQRWVRGFREDPVGMSLRAFGAIMLPEMILYSLNRDDPDWWEQPQFMRDYFHLIKVPTPFGERMPEFLSGTPEDSPLRSMFQPWENQDGTIWLRIPKAFELGIVLGGMTVRTLEWMDGEDPAELRRALAEGLQREVISTVLPVPQAVLPIGENAANFSTFFRRDIDPPYIRNVAREFRPGRWDVLEEMAEMQHRIGVPRALRHSPNQLENIFSAYTGTLGRHALRASEGLYRGTRRALGDDVPSKPWEFADVPGLGGFIARDPTWNSESVQRLFREWQAVDSSMSTIQLFEREGRQDRLDRHYPPEEQAIVRQRHGELRAALDLMASLRSQRDMIQRDTRMRPEEKSEVIRDLGRQYTDVARETLQRVYPGAGR